MMPLKSLKILKMLHLELKQEKTRNTNYTNIPVVIFIPAVNICPTLKKNRGDSEGRELADGVTAHTGGVTVDCQV